MSIPVLSKRVAEVVSYELCIVLESLSFCSFPKNYPVISCYNFEAFFRNTIAKIKGHCPANDPFWGVHFVHLRREFSYLDVIILIFWNMFWFLFRNGCYSFSCFLRSWWRILHISKQQNDRKKIYESLCLIVSLVNDYFFLLTFFSVSSPDFSIFLS